MSRGPYWLRGSCLLLLAFCVWCPPVLADLTPYVAHGPVITGVTDTEAWVTWYTAHHQGSADSLNQCFMDALTGTANDTIPTLNLEPPASSGQTTFEDAECSHFHHAHLTGLLPATSYSFGLDMPYANQDPAIGQFTTAPPGDAAFRFVVFGDNRNGPFTEPSTRADHQAMVDAILKNESEIAFVLNPGDLALNLPVVSGADQGYAEFFEVERALLAAHPFFSALGNHESLDTTFFDGLISAPTFASLPHPTYFSMDWGKAHVVVLDSFEGGYIPLLGRSPLVTDQQVEWLRQDLQVARSAGQLIFLLSHQGAFSHGADSESHGGSADVQAKVVPLMVEFGALAMFAGHDHYYQRGHEACIDYLVVGAGGAPMYEPDPAAPGVIVTRKVPSYLVVSVDGQGASAVAKDKDGNIIDSFQFSPALCQDEPDGGLEDGGFGDADTQDAALPDHGADAAVQVDDLIQTESVDGGEQAAVDVDLSGPDMDEDVLTPAAGCGCGLGVGSGPIALLAMGSVMLGWCLRKRG